MKYIKIFEMEEDELALDGQARPGGNLHIKEYEDDEWRPVFGTRSRQCYSSVVW